MAASHTDLSLYRRLLWQARPYWPLLVGIFLMSLVSTPLTLLTPVPLKIAVDSVVGSKPLPDILDGLVPDAVSQSNTGTLLFAAGLMVTVALLGQIQSVASSVLSAYTSEKLVLSFRAWLFRHVQRLSFSYHDSKGISDLTYRIQYDVPAAQSVAMNGVIPFVSGAITLSSMLFIMVLLDWQLSAIALTVSPALFVITQVYRRRLRGQSLRVKALESSALSVVQEVLGAMRVVKAFGQEDREQERFVQRSSEGVRARIRLLLVEGSFGLLVGMGTSLGTAAVLYVGVRHVQSGTLSLGELLLMMGYLSQLYAPLKTMSRSVAKLQSSIASAERAFAVLDEMPDVAERPHARPLRRAVGAVSFRNVSFAYSADRPVLHDIWFDVVPGTRVGIAGATGAGKSTLVSLLTRFYDPVSGQILLDGTDLRDYKLADLRDQFAIVLQEPVLFSTSIADNIAYARPGASAEQIIAAAKAADVHEFIAALPESYETQVGERGMQLSGGERQRIALARAFLKDAPILILDEPTSSVDARTEATIMEALERLTQGRTSFMIAHRLSTLERCDLRLELEHGRLIEARGAPAAAARRELRKERQQPGMTDVPTVPFRPR